MSDLATMNGKTCIVTGANSGIGFETALELARRGAHVVIIDRDRPDDILGAIAEEIPGATVDYFVTDLSDHTQVRDLADRLNSKYDSIEVLVNNAGRHLVRRETSADGIEMNLALNCLAPYILTHLLMDKLIASAPARIVNVASEAHRVPGRFNFEDLDTEQEPMTYAYGKSKIANILWVKALARRLDGTGVTINAVCPGLVATNIFDNYLPGWVSKVAPAIAKTGLMATSETGAQMQIRLAADEEFEGVSGEYFSSHAVMKRLPQVKPLSDRELQERVYALAADMTGLSFERERDLTSASEQLI